VTVSAPGRERILEFRALMQKAQSENTADQLRGRGEFYSGPFMCKVQLMSPAELSQCIGATEASMVTLAVSRGVAGQPVAFPSLQRDLISEITARVRARGG